jgi:hypothetical protein
MPPKVAKVRELLSAMPVEDQLSLLLIAIIEINPSALGVSLRMLGATVKLSEHLSAENRFRVSEAMRDHADKRERPCVAVRT